MQKKLGKLPSMFLITIIFSLSRLSSVFAQEVSSNEEPVLMQESYQVWASDILKGNDVVLDEQIGSQTLLENLEETSTDYNYVFELKEREDLPYVKLDIQTPIESDTVYYIRNLQDGREWRTRAFSNNIFQLREGEYEITFSNVDSEKISFSLKQVEFPFIGRVAVLDPNIEYDFELIKKYMDRGGKLLLYGNEDLLTELEVSVESKEITSETNPEFNFPEGTLKAQVLNMSMYDGVYEPLNSFDAKIKSILYLLIALEISSKSEPPWRTIPLIDSRNNCNSGRPIDIIVSLIIINPPPLKGRYTDKY